MKKTTILSSMILALGVTFSANAAHHEASEDKAKHHVTSIYQDAVANPARSEKDRSVDDRRKPGSVLEFFEIKPSMKVFDVFAGGGYYSEILSYLVGPEGGVTLYNNAPWDAFVNKAVTPRLADNRLPNVTRLVATPESLLEQDAAKYDAAIFILGMHDIYYADPDTGWVAIDKDAFLRGIHHILKEGGVLGIIDANALPGADNEVIGKSVHRVDPQAVIDDVKKAGFTLVEESDLLRNPEDDRVSSVFSPENRYNTDRSILKFKK